MKKFLLWSLLWLVVCSPSWAQADAGTGGGLKVNLGVGASITGGSVSMYSHENKKLMNPWDKEILIGCTNWHFEFISDFLPQSERISFGTGLRITGQTASSRYWEDMYWLVKEGPNLRDYVSIGSMSQRNFYLGVPLYFRVFFNSQENRVRPYVKFDASMDFLLGYRNSIDITNSHMRTLYEDKLEEEMGKPDHFHVSSSAAVGLRINCNHFYVCPEIVLPRIEIGGSPFTFFDKSEYIGSVGVKLSFLFPMGNNAKDDTAEVKTSYSSNIQQENSMPVEDF